MFLLPIIAASILRIYLIFRDSVPFAYDMGRDLLWAKDISFYGIPTLIGPAASIWGVYFGPLWFYFLSIPLLISGGHPLSAVFATSAMIILTGVLTYILFKNYIPNLYAITLSIVILFSATLINISTFAFHANILPLLSLMMIYFLFLSAVKNPLFISLAFLSVSLMFHADPAPAVVFTFIPLFFFFYFKLYKSKNLPRIIILSLAAYLFPFTPQILFEIRNSFIQTQSLVAYFQGQNPSLSGQLPFLERIVNRVSVYLDFFKASFAHNFIIFFSSMIITGIYRFLKTNKNKNLSILFKINLLSFVITFLIFTIPFTVEIKNWYLYGVLIFFAFLITFGFLGFKKNRILTLLLLTTFLLLNILPFFKKERNFKAQSDPAQLTNQIAAIDKIYGDLQTLPFSVYVFTPSIYDLHYQYLFWWYGKKLKKGFPSDFAYLPNQPDYVRNKQIYFPNPQPSNIVYLIIENASENQFYTKENWLKNFNDLQLVWEKDINGAIILQKRIR